MKFKRIIIDSSHASFTDANTGVQRVVRNLLANIRGCCHADVETVVCIGDQFIQTGGRQYDRLRKVRVWQRNVVAATPAFYRWAAMQFCKVIRGSAVKWLLPYPGHQGLFWFPLKLAEWRARRGLSSKIVTPTRGDLLILPDAYWAHPEALRQAELAKQRGAVLTSVVYDVIPLTHPELVDDDAKAPFEDYLYRIAKVSDVIVAISETVKNQLRDELLCRWPNETFCENLHSFCLGAVFKKTKGEPRQDITELFAGVQAPYLMVGSVDPRKNHQYVLDAFETFWRHRPGAKLCIIGAISSKGQDIAERIRQHPRYGKQLFHFCDASDGELCHAYEKARAVCFSSIAEGFGLPIVEALWNRCSVFAVDTPIHREVGKDGCIYSDPQRPSDMAERLRRWEEDGCPSTVGSQMVRTLTWAQSTQEFLDVSLSAITASSASVDRVVADLQPNSRAA